MDRPVNGQERAKNAIAVVDMTSSREVTVRERNAGNVSKTFTFDRVFGPHSKQVTFFDYNIFISFE
jgi:hypothetical protein